MKVVLFCGGLGTRLREYSETIPKPLVNIGYRPILWNLMRYYAHYGHKDFILCLGYRGDMIKDFFLNYDECVSNDFVLSNGGKDVELLSSDIHDWRITFVEKIKPPGSTTATEVNREFPLKNATLTDGRLRFTTIRLWQGQHYESVFELEIHRESLTGRWTGNSAGTLTLTRAGAGGDAGEPAKMRIWSSNAP